MVLHSLREDFEEKVTRPLERVYCNLKMPLSSSHVALSVGSRSNLQHHVEVAHVAEDPGRYGCQVCSIRHSRLADYSFFFGIFHFLALVALVSLGYVAELGHILGLKEGKICLLWNCQEHKLHCPRGECLPGGAV